jgi:hypothetical protein
MKKLLIPVFIVVSAILLLSFVKSDATSSEVLMIRGYILVTGPKGASTIKIYKGTENTEIIDLGKISDKESFDLGMNKIIQTVNKYTSDGYEIISSTEFGGGASVILNFILKK